jgi:omega-6 fatty acid desaturase (delta-12 desaturase)
MPTRSSKDLLIASREFAEEQRGRSWFHLWTTLLALTAAVALACTPTFWPLQLVGSAAVALVLVRMFILYHDYEHGAILQNSRLARAIMTVVGWLLLSPPKTWKHAHDHHHQHNAQTFSKSLGTYPVMTTEDYARASRGQRFFYAIVRNPLTLLFGYATVFLWEICIHTLVHDRRSIKDIGPALVLHAGLIVGMALLGGWPLLLFGLLLPVLMATAMGSYLFYAQHNFPSVKFASEENWDYTFAALHSSSFCRMSRVMHWFTGNIGYHHVHHLNARIPFYRLPAAMAAMPELQAPGETSLLPWDVLACLRLKLWDEEAGRMVSFGEARRARRRATMAPCPTISPARPQRSPKSSSVLVAESSLPKAAPGV